MGQLGRGIWQLMNWWREGKVWSVAWLGWGNLLPCDLCLQMLRLIMKCCRTNFRCLGKVDLLLASLPVSAQQGFAAFIDHAQIPVSLVGRQSDVLRTDKM